MHADLRLQQPVRVLAIHFERDALDARALTLQPVRNHRRKLLALRPSQVHAQQHLRPILTFRAAGAGVNGHDRAALIVLAAEQHGGFQPLQQFAVRLEVALDIGLHWLALARQLEHRVQIVCHAADAIVVIDGLFQALSILHDLLTFFGLIPEIRRRDLLFGFC